MTPRSTSTTHGAAQDATRCLPPHLAQSVWLGHSLGEGSQRVLPSGHPQLDGELPGGGWPCQSLTEVLHEQAGQAEWRLLAPALREVVQRGGHILLIAPPFVPHVPALHRQGVSPERLILIDAHTPQECLWATEQALQAGCFTAVLSWLPQVRASSLRRLQVCAARHPGPAFIFRPARCRAESSAAPLRLHLSLGPFPHPMILDIVKRRGPSRVLPLLLPSWPPDLLALLRPPARPAPLVLPSSAHPLTAHAELDRTAAGSPRHAGGAERIAGVTPGAGWL
nr:translesion DNA synthesis-associated protein ImuA [uncultured Aquabacterium sp.]